MSNSPSTQKENKNGLCRGLKDRYLPRKVRMSLGMENITPFPPNYYNIEIKGLPGKDIRKGITVLY